MWHVRYQLVWLLPCIFNMHMQDISFATDMKEDRGYA